MARKKIRQKIKTTNNIVNAQTVGFVGCTIENNNATIGETPAVAAKKRKARSKSSLPLEAQAEVHSAPPPPYEEEKTSSSASVPKRKKARHNRTERSKTPVYDGGESASPSPSPARLKRLVPEPHSPLPQNDNDNIEPAPPTPSTVPLDTTSLLPHPQSSQSPQSYTVKSSIRQPQQPAPPPTQSLRQRLLMVSDTLRSIQQYDDDMMDVLLQASKQLMEACYHLKKIQERKAKGYAAIAEQLPVLIEDPLLRENDHWLTSRDDDGTEIEPEKASAQPKESLEAENEAKNVGAASEGGVTIRDFF